MIIHTEKSPLAGQFVRIKPDAKHHIYCDFAGSQIRIIDWWDRVYGKPIDLCPYDIVASIYGARWARFMAASVPVGQDNEVLVGKIKDGHHAVHISELDLPDA